MDNTCVMCSNPMELPEGTNVCPRCQRGEYLKSPLCPSCGTTLETMSTSKYETNDGFGYSSIYHCNHCGDDWEKEEEYIAKPVIFQRKYWG